MNRALLILVLALASSVFSQTTVVLTVTGPDGSVVQYQQQPSYQVSVTPSTSTGTVAISVDNNSIGNCTLSGGSCTFTPASGVLTVGSHTASALYNGTTGSSTFKVTAVADLALTSTPSGVISAGVAVVLTVTATLYGSSSAPSGVFTFTNQNNSASLGSCSITSGLACSYTIPSGTLQAGQNYTVVANYPGDSLYDQAYSPSIFLQVSNSATTASTTASATTASVTTGASITTGASVTANSASTTGNTITTGATVTTGSIATSGSVASTGSTITSGSSVTASVSVTSGATSGTVTSGSTTAKITTTTTRNNTASGSSTTTTTTTTSGASATVASAFIAGSLLLALAF